MKKTTLLLGRSLAVSLTCSVLLLAASVEIYARTFSGLIYPMHDITLSAGVTGLVTQRSVQLGQSVKADQVLIQLDDSLQVIESNRRKVIFEDKSEIYAARERSRILTTLLRDAQAVFASTGSISKDEILRLEAEQVASSARLEQLIEQKKRELLDFETSERERMLRRITAPVDGIVTKLTPQVGEWAKPGDPVVSLVDASTAILRLAVPHVEANTLKVGAAKMVKLEPGSIVAQITGRISFVSPVADPASGLVQVEITFNNTKHGIKPGIKGMIDIGAVGTLK